MKKFLKIGLISLLALAAVSAIIYKAVNKAPAEDLPQNEQVLQIFTAGGCVDCHSAEPQLPFYAEFPVIGDMVKKDSQDGYRAFDMTGLMAALENGEYINVAAGKTIVAPGDHGNGTYGAQKAYRMVDNNINQSLGAQK